MREETQKATAVDDAASLKNLILVAVASVGITQLISYLCDCGTGLLHASAAFTIVVQLVVYGHASGLVFGNAMTEKYYDLTGSCTYVSGMLLSAYLCPRELTERQKVLITLVVVWAIRLGVFLFTRIVSAGGEDSRFVRLKRNRYRFAIPWIVQGVWVFLTALPVFIINANANETGALALAPLDYVGVLLWLVGFLTEVVADTQKLQWRSVPGNKDKYIDTGLWALSRHPNCKHYCCL